MHIFFSRYLTRLKNYFAWSVLLHGSESWTLRAADIKRLEIFTMLLWRSMEKIKMVRDS